MRLPNPVFDRSLLLGSLLLLGSCSAVPNPEPVPADAVARWLDRQAVVDGQRAHWPVHTEEGAAREPATNLYSGTPGVILFYLEHYRQTGRPHSLEMARAGCDWMLTQWPDAILAGGAGLYTGLCGPAFVLLEAWETTGDLRYRVLASQMVNHLRFTAKADGDGLVWGEVTDVIGGTAGTGLFLLWAAERMEDPSLVELAAAAGDALLARAEGRGRGLSWAMRPDYPREMPGFSHGTAGVGFFLARLHEATGEPRYLDAARRGGLHLRSLTGPRGWIHHNQTTPDLHYLGWCHGPAGTSRLFAILHDLTGEPEWAQWIQTAAGSVLLGDLLEERSPGLWNNHGQCCGTAGLGRFAEEHELWIGTEASESFQRRAAAEIARAAIRGEEGARWDMAENRVRPEELSTQTGYMQGAAGIGLFLLRWQDRQAPKPRAPERIVFPDSLEARPQPARPDLELPDPPPTLKRWAMESLSTSTSGR